MEWVRNETTVGCGNLWNIASVYSYCIPIGARVSFLWVTNMTQFEKNAKNAVWQGTLSLMVLRTLLTMGGQHGYGIARRIEQTSDRKLSINYGTLYPALLKLEQEGLIVSHWGVSENNRKAKFYKLTRKGRSAAQAEVDGWLRLSSAVTKVLRAIEQGA